MEKKVLDCQFSIDIKNIVEEDNIGIIEGIASAFGNVDDGRDIVVQGAFTESLRKIQSTKGKIPLLLQHSPKDVIGKIRSENIRETKEGLFVKAEINLGTTLGRDTFALVKNQDLDRFSIGYKTIESSIDTVNRARRLEVLDLWEVSVVSFAMNDKAAITAVKSIFHDLSILRDDDMQPNTRYEWDEAKALENITASQDDLKSAYLLENEEDDGENKFLIADIVDGELKAIPRAIFAAAGALCGDRGGLGLSDEQKTSMQRNIERYYEKLDIESPFKKGVGPNELGRMSPKQIKTYLRDNGFSGAGAEYLSHMASKGIKSLSDSGNNSPRDSGLDASLKGLRDSLKQSIGG